MFPQTSALRAPAGGRSRPVDANVWSSVPGMLSLSTGRHCAVAAGCRDGTLDTGFRASGGPAEPFTPAPTVKLRGCTPGQSSVPS